MTVRAFFSPIDTRIRFYNEFDMAAGIEPWESAKYTHTIGIKVIPEDAPELYYRHAVEWPSEDKEPQPADIEKAKNLLSEWAKERFGVVVIG